MTRKDYVFLAAVCKAFPLEWRISATVIMARDLKRNDSSFYVEKFLLAAGLTPKEIANSMQKFFRDGWLDSPRKTKRNTNENRQEYDNLMR